MLQSTFIHIPGVGKTYERKLWENRIITWDDFLENCNNLNLPREKSEVIRKNCIVSKKQFELGNHWFFSRSLPLDEHWRAYPSFNCCFLDIETTGLDKQMNKITTIGVYDGEKSRVFVRGKDMDEFPEYIKNYSMIVTFNGRCFDLPFLKLTFPVELDQFHVDLRFFMKRLGYTGGLKKIEKQMGITRSDEIDEVDGLEAVRLWKKYERGDEQALKKLVAYNASDVENLKPMMDSGFEMMMGRFSSATQDK